MDMNDWIIACLNLTRSYPVTWVLTRSQSMTG